MLAVFKKVRIRSFTEIYVKRFKKERSIRKRRLRISVFLVVQDRHRQQRETSSKKMMLKSKTATTREATQNIRGP